MRSRTLSTAGLDEIGSDIFWPVSRMTLGSCIRRISRYCFRDESYHVSPLGTLPHCNPHTERLVDKVRDRLNGSSSGKSTRQNWWARPDSATVELICPAGSGFNEFSEGSPKNLFLVVLQRFQTDVCCGRFIESFAVQHLFRVHAHGPDHLFQRFNFANPSPWSDC